MSFINPMFTHQKPSVTTQNTVSKTSNVRKHRKTRSDKKHDVKIPLTMEQRQWIKILAKKQQMTPTQFCTEKITQALSRNLDYPEREYSSHNNKSYHAKLNATDYNLLFDYAIKWDCSSRRAAHRILSKIVELEVRYYEGL